MPWYDQLISPVGQAQPAPVPPSDPLRQHSANVVLDPRLPGRAYTDQPGKGPGQPNYGNDLQQWYMERGDVPYPLQPYEMQGLSPTDLGWLLGQHVRTMTTARDNADVARMDHNARLIHNSPSDVVHEPGSSLDLTERSRLDEAQRHERRAIQVYKDHEFANHVDPLQPYRDQVRILETANPGSAEVMLPPPVQTVPDAAVTIAGQLEARRRALGGDVSIASPWNAMPGTY